MIDLTGQKILIAAGLCLLIPFTASAQTPQEILTKSKAVYQSAKTYQADYSVKVDSDFNNSVSVGRIQVEGTKYRVDSETKDELTTMRQTIVSDGKTVCVYIASTHQYSKSPYRSRGQITPLTRLLDADNAMLKKLPDAIISGVPVYLLQSGLIGAQANKPGSVATTTLAIDKRTYRLVRVINIVNNSKIVERYSHEVFNAPIPPQTFVFTPPAGSKPLR